MAERQGPATFAIEADQAVTMAQLPQSAGPQVRTPGVSPGMSVQGGGVDDTNAKTFRAITELAGGVLAPKIKEAAQEQYIAGVQRAMTGEALGEIIKDQPWYTDVFAPSSALAGARTYTAESSIATWAGKMQEQMPVLARQNPEALRNAAVGAMQGFMTGDAAADALITQGMVQQMAPLFKQHAKEHYIYVQKQASTAQIGAWEAHAKVFQGLASAEASGKGTVSPEDREAAKTRLLSSITPFADQSDESYERNILQFLEGAATQGSFQVVKLFKDSGLYDKLNPDKRATLDRQLATAGRVALDKQAPQFAMDVAMLVNDMEQNPAGIVEKVQALNAKAARMTGVTEADLIPMSSLDNIIGRVLTTQRNEALRDARAVKPPDTGVANAAAQIGLQPGAVDRCVANGICKEQDVEQAGVQLWAAAKTPQEKIALLNARTLKPFEGIKSSFQNTIRAEEYKAGGVGEMAVLYKGMAENVKPMYFNEKQMAVMDRFQAQVQAGMLPEHAWVVARNSSGVAEYSISDDAKSELAKTIRSHVEKENETWYGANNVDDAALRTIEALTMRSFKAARQNNPVGVSVARAYAIAKSNGLDIQGPHAIVKIQPSDRDLFAIVGEGRKATADAFAELMKEKAKAMGATLDNYEAIRVPDRGGQASIYVNAVDESGTAVTWFITSPEIKAQVVKKIKPAAGVFAPLGPRSASGKVTE